MADDSTQDGTLSPLPEDNDTPFTPADEDDVVLGESHQLMDYKSDIDSHELFDEGPEAAAVDLPARDDSGILDYTPPEEIATDTDAGPGTEQEPGA